MAVQNIVIKYDVDTSDLERAEDILLDNAKAAGLSEEETSAYNKQLRITSKEINQLSQQASKLEKSIEGATDEDEVKRLNRELVTTRKRMRELGTEAGKTEDQVSGIGQSLLAGFAGGAIAGIFEGILGNIQQVTQESIELFGIQEAAEAKVLAAILATNGAAGKSLDDLKQTASEIQALTIFGDEAILEAQSTLLTFRNVQGEVFDNAIGLAADLSTVLNTDLESSTLQLGKALNDPITGITALTRAGITFDEQQKEQIKTLTESGRVAKAQGVILEELANQVGGAAAAVAQSGTGPLIQLENAIGDIKEEIGSELIPAQESALQLQELFFQGLLKTVQGIVFFINALKEVPNFLRENQAELGVLLATILTLNAANIAAAAATIAKSAAEKAAIISTRALAVAQRVLNVVLSANPIGLVVAAVGALTIGFIRLYKESQTLRAGLSGTFQALRQIATNVIDNLVQRFTSLGEILAGVFTLDYDRIAAGADQFADSFGGLAEGVQDAFNEGFDAKVAEERASEFTKAISDQIDKAVESGTIKKSADGLRSSIQGALSGGVIDQAQANELIDRLDDVATQGFNPAALSVNTYTESLEENTTATDDNAEAQKRLQEQVDKLATQIRIASAGGAGTLAGLDLQEADQIAQLRSQEAFIELQKQNEELANQAILNIQDEFAQRRVALIEKNAQESIQAQRDVLTREIASISAELTSQNLLISQLGIIDVDNLQDQFNQGLISRQEFENGLAEIEADGIEKRESLALNSLIKINEARKQLITQNTLEIAQIEQVAEANRSQAEQERLNRLRIQNQTLENETITTEQEIANARVDINERANQAILENDQSLNQERLENAQELLNSANSITSSVTDFFEGEKQRELAAVEDNAEEQERIRERYARREKALAISQALIGASLAVIRVLSNLTTLPEPIGTIQKIAAAATIGAAALNAVTQIRSVGFAEGIREVAPQNRRKVRGKVSGKRGVDDIPALIKGKFGETERVFINEGERITPTEINKRFFEDLNAIENGSFAPGVIAKAGNIDQKLFNQFVNSGGDPIIKPIAYPVSRMVPINSQVHKVNQIDYKKLGKEVADSIEAKKWSRNSSFWRELDNLEVRLPKMIAKELAKVINNGN